VSVCLYINVARRRYVNSDDEADSGDNVDTKRSKKSSQPVSKEKETPAAAAESRVSRTRLNPQQDSTKSTADSRGRSTSTSVSQVSQPRQASQQDNARLSRSRSAVGKSSMLSSSKENQCIDEDKQVCLCLSVALSITGTNSGSR